MALPLPSSPHWTCRRGRSRARRLLRVGRSVTVSRAGPVPDWPGGRQGRGGRRRARGPPRRRGWHVRGRPRPGRTPAGDPARAPPSRPRRPPAAPRRRGVGEQERLVAPPGRLGQPPALGQRPLGWRRSPGSPQLREHGRDDRVRVGEVGRGQSPAWCGRRGPGAVAVPGAVVGDPAQTTSESLTNAPAKSGQTAGSPSRRRPRSAGRIRPGEVRRGAQPGRELVDSVSEQPGACGSGIASTTAAAGSPSTVSRPRHAARPRRWTGLSRAGPRRGRRPGRAARPGRPSGSARAWSR